MSIQNPRHGEYVGYTKDLCRCDLCRAANRRYKNKLKASKTGLPAGDPRHGSALGYDYHRCRCPLCTAVHRENNRKSYRKMQQTVLGDDDPRHGKVNTYNSYGCRCEKCVDAQRRQADAWRNSNPESYRASKAAWASKNPEASTKGTKRYDRRKADANCGCVTSNTLLEVWHLNDGLCTYCGDPGKSYDHVIPLAGGGQHCVANIRLSCTRCNSTKGSRSVEYLLERLQQLGVSPVVETALPPSLRCPKLQVAA